MKYKAILLATTAIALLWIIRIGLSGTFLYGFIYVNVLLAIIPLLIESVFPLIKKHLKSYWAYICNGVAAIVWLLFLPNAFYILTDFMHLNSNVVVNAPNDNYHHGIDYVRGDGLYVYDSLLLFAATLLGAYVGGLVLVHAYLFFRKHTARIYSTVAIGTIMFLSATGVYIGRFGRWNSWQGLTNPHNIVSDLYYELLDPTKRQRFFLIIVTILIFQLASFLLILHFQKTRIAK